jgi:hypothetical protein
VAICDRHIPAEDPYKLKAPYRPRPGPPVWLAGAKVQHRLGKDPGEPPDHVVNGHDPERPLVAVDEGEGAVTAHVHAVHRVASLPILRSMAIRRCTTPKTCS